MTRVQVVMRPKPSSSVTGSQHTIQAGLVDVYISVDDTKLHSIQNIGLQDRFSGTCSSIKCLRDARTVGSRNNQIKSPGFPLPFSKARFLQYLTRKYHHNINNKIFHPTGQE